MKLDNSIDSLLQDGFSKLEIKLSPRQINQLKQYITLLVEFGSHTNIIGTLDPKEILIKHILDCATAYPLMGLKENEHVADIGSGGGFPGIILSILANEPFFIVKYPFHLFN